MTETSRLKNIFTVCGNEAIEALSLKSVNMEYYATKIDLDNDLKCLKTRLTGGDEMINGHINSLPEKEENKKGKAVVRVVTVQTQNITTNAILVEAIDLESQNHMQIIYPYEESTDNQPFQIHRPSTLKVRGMDPQTENVRINEFFDGIESAQDFMSLQSFFTNNSVSFS